MLALPVRNDAGFAFWLFYESRFPVVAGGKTIAIWGLPCAYVIGSIKARSVFGFQPAKRNFRRHQLGSGAFVDNQTVTFLCSGLQCRASHSSDAIQIECSFRT